MARRYTHVLGLDIGSSAVKAVELRHTAAGIEVVGKPTVVPTPEHAVEGGVIVDSVAVKEAILELLARGEFRTKHTIASVGGDSSVVVRITEVPKMTGKELQEAIQWELDRQTPFPIDQTFYDYAPIEPPDADPNAQNMEVLIAVAQEDMINTHVDTIMSAKLVPAAIDIEPLAISRALVDVAGPEFADQTVGVVHVGASSSMILVIRKRLLSFYRLIPTGGQALTQAIRQNFMGDEKLSEHVKRAFADLSEEVAAAEGQPVPGARPAAAESIFAEEEAVDSVFELSDATSAGALADQALEAEGIATQLDLPGPEQVAMPPSPAPTGPPPTSGMSEEEVAARQIVYEAIAPTVVDLATEVRRSIDFYRRQHRNEEVDRILLSGGSAPMPGLALFIASETGIHTQVADPFAYLTVDEAVTPRQYLNDIGPTMVVAVGLALRDMVA